eukprot:2781650-Rhodomonas_salina.2
MGVKVKAGCHHHLKPSAHHQAQQLPAMCRWKAVHVVELESVGTCRACSVSIVHRRAQRAAHNAAQEDLGWRFLEGGSNSTVKTPKRNPTFNYSPKSKTTKPLFQHKL